MTKKVNALEDTLINQSIKKIKILLRFESIEMIIEGYFLEATKDFSPKINRNFKRVKNVGRPKKSLHIRNCICMLF